MPLNLPPTLGGSSPLRSNLPKNIGKIGVPTNIGRAQSTQVTKLQQQIDREGAKVSMNQVLSAKAEAQGQKTTSINRVGMGVNAPTSSITHAQGQTVTKTSINGPERTQNTESTAGDDDRRYTYMRRLIKARQAKEKALAEASQKNNSPLSVGTGTAMTHSGASGFHKEVGKFFKSNRTKFSHLSSSQKAVLEKTIEGKLKSKTTGSEITRHDRMDMKKQIGQAKAQGTIGASTARQFKKIVGKLGT